MVPAVTEAFLLFVWVTFTVREGQIAKGWYMSDKALTEVNNLFLHLKSERGKSTVCATFNKELRKHLAFAKERLADFEVRTVHFAVCTLLLASHSRLYCR